MKNVYDKVRGLKFSGQLYKYVERKIMISGVSKRRKYIPNYQEINRVELLVHSPVVTSDLIDLFVYFYSEDCLDVY